jgi:DNA-binding NarL/FixJ family response regulator
LAIVKILFVEDNAGFAGDLRRAISEVLGITDVLTVADKESAIDALMSDEIIDLVVLDLAIPPSKQTDSAHPEHGQSVFYDARSLRPGTPIFILTGSEADKFSRGLAKLGNQVRLWGDSTPIETVSYFLKEEVDELVQRVSSMAVIFEKMSRVAINTRGKDLGLSAVETRMLKSYANSVDCVACDVSLLSGGLSGAKVVKATAIDSSRKAQVLCAGKLGARAIISSELNAYEKHAKKLGIGACPTLFSSIENGVGPNGAIFYTLTDDDTLSLFDRLAKDASIGPTVVRRVRNALRRWSEAATAGLVTIREIRSRLISDKDFEKVSKKFALNDILEIENYQVQSSMSCIHGDLHCGNVLVRSNGDAVVIDFGDADLGFTCLDPIALELSLVFHPDAKKLGLRDGLIANLCAWPDLELFAVADILKPTVVSCREWAHDVGGGDRAVLAAAYAYGLRQLKYDTVDSEITVRFLRHLVERIRET